MSARSLNLSEDLPISLSVKALYSAVVLVVVCSCNAKFSDVGALPIMFSMNMNLCVVKVMNYVLYLQVMNYVEALIFT